MRCLFPLTLAATLLLAACQPTTVEKASPVPVTVEVTRLAEVTKLVQVTRLVEVTRIVKVTPLPTDTPAGPTNTPAPTATPEPTADPLRAPRGPGSYMVGTEIAAGIWRSEGTAENCYLKVTNLSGDLVNNTLDPPGATFRVPSGDFVVVIESGSFGCTWTFLKP